MSHVNECILILLLDVSLSDSMSNRTTWTLPARILFMNCSCFEEPLWAMAAHSIPLLLLHEKGEGLDVT
jgi:hypothetical protein